ncbi:phage tail sheath subtilisin-like domain-containing protein [Clostridium tertium]|uniref:phage tail sheath subtilisin-like domain-containing protein n=1 Tax=Clostridium tertium TaxID=1559 RepID=UPI00115C1935|nr:phage tail sheath subtilisin-like domain-containing protein [Clostridium tertium]MDB1956512.1 phage tail sheath subtilisin-like domain-containing protein [Clostridium tertium]MDB1958813.1 phage tail sheath subtilisin-like domain-containing protein [Clostridium tertium]MDB1962320.1 phage tail sheath subtilisin-like domain-containing protein [Clostridium tertium]MDB1967564.1 phage tail sheath subtilisin-like domain-containing protein [Clostridium tertium]
MGGTWTNQDKILPGAYINFKTNSPLSITPKERGIVLILQKLSVGKAHDIYEITATTDNYPEGIKANDKIVVNEALKGASKVLLYNLGNEEEITEVLTAALSKLRTIDFNVIAYPNASESDKGTIKTWITSMRDEEGIKIQGVFANLKADNEAIINIVQGVILSDGTELTAEQVTAYVAGITAGAAINKSNTGLKYEGAIDVTPRMTKTEMETAIKEGKYIFKVDSAQNVTTLYDINSLTTVGENKNNSFKKNRTIRTLDGINNDTVNIFESNYIGNINNNTDGRSLLRSAYIEYFNLIQNLNAIQNFTAEDVEVLEGKDKEAVVINCNIQTVDSVEKMYITINLS